MNLISSVYWAARAELNVVQRLFSRNSDREIVSVFPARMEHVEVSWARNNRSQNRQTSTSYASTQVDDALQILLNNGMFD